MKKTIFYLVVISFICFLSIKSYSQSPNWLWAKSLCGTGGGVINSSAVDKSGNTYVAGTFSCPTIVFGSTTLTNYDNTGNSNNLFIAKYDTNGDLLWVKSAGGIGDDRANSIDIDASGNAYITGFANSSTISFGSTTLINNGYNDIFFAKYDANGNVLWAKNAEGVPSNTFPSLTVDISGNVYLAGGFSSPTIIFGSDTLTNASSYADIYLVKFDNNGTPLWARSAGGIYDDEATSISVDTSGNVYMIGDFSSPTITFGSFTLINSGTGSNNIFIAKYNANGNVLWANAGGMIDDNASSVAVDASGNAYMIGTFYSPTITFGSITLTNAGGDDIFLTKYDANGNLVWAKSAGGNESDVANSVAVDALGNIYIAGAFNSTTITFGSTTLTNADFFDIFLAKYNANGNVIWAKSAGGYDEDEASSVKVDVSGNTYVAGFYESSAIIFGSDTLKSMGNADLFLAKLAAFAVTTTQTNVSCYGGNNGTATANATGGGISPFTYLWDTSPAQTTQTITGLVEGNYIVTVTDHNGASNTDSLAIVQPIAITSSINITNPSPCTASNGNATVNVLGGTMPYTFIWNPTGQTTQTVTGLAADTFVVLITDLNGCIHFDTAVVGCPNSIPQFIMQNTIAVYPNPVNDNLIIEAPQQSLIKIANIQGQLIKTLATTSNKTNIDVSALPDGVYVVEVKTEKGVEVKKFIKE